MKGTGGEYGRTDSELLRKIVHDLNNSLSPVLGLSDMALANPDVVGDRAKMKRYMRDIRDSVLEAIEIVDRLRSLYRRS